MGKRDGGRAIDEVHAPHDHCPCSGRRRLGDFLAASDPGPSPLSPQAWVALAALLDDPGVAVWPGLSWGTAVRCAPTKTARRLGFRGGELNLGGFAGCFGGLEVGFVAFEAGPAGEDAVGEQADVGVVGLDGVVVALAFHGDAIFGAGQFVLQSQEVFVGF